MGTRIHYIWSVRKVAVERQPFTIEIHHWVAVETVCSWRHVIDRLFDVQRDDVTRHGPNQHWDRKCELITMIVCQSLLCGSISLFISLFFKLICPHLCTFVCVCLPLIVNLIIDHIFVQKLRLFQSSETWHSSQVLPTTATTAPPPPPPAPLLPNLVFVSSGFPQLQNRPTR